MKPTPYSILLAHPVLGHVIKAIDDQLQESFGNVSGIDFYLSGFWKRHIYEKDVERAQLSPQTAEMIAAVYRPEWKATLCDYADGFMIKFSPLKQHLKLS